MQVLNTGTTYKIFDESMRAFNQMPAGVYKIGFSPMTGYSLIKTDNIEVNEKIYGNHLAKVEKVYKTFKVFPRNLGIILSGDKGIGKSLFAKLLSIKAVENGYPIIICDCHYPGIADFLGSIQQEVVVLFDEFDKTFNQKKEESDAQAEMLTLFDGLYMGKKMFIITCNEIRYLNDYLINRPGRFHYHFRFEYPTEAEVNEYMKDKVTEEFWGEIPAVVEFSKKVDLNFDCLRAIAFELNMGSTFAEAAKDLNIVNVEKPEYTALLYFKDGTVYKRSELRIDLFNDSEEIKSWFNHSGKYPNVFVTFNTTNHYYDYDKGAIVVPKSDIDIFFEKDEYFGSNEEELTSKADNFERIGVDFLILKREYSRNNIHYTV